MLDYPIIANGFYRIIIRKVVWLTWTQHGLGQPRLYQRTFARLAQDKGLIKQADFDDESRHCFGCKVKNLLFPTPLGSIYP